MYIGLWAVVVD